MTVANARSTDAADAADTVGRLRQVLRVNAAFSAVSAVALLAAPKGLGDLLGTGHPGWIRVIGVALAVFAVDVAVLARSREPWARAGGRVVAAADAGWVMASAAAIGLGWFEPRGVAVVVAVAVVVGALAVAEFLTAR